jgi:hypothetical protein
MGAQQLADPFGEGRIQCRCLGHPTSITQ